MGDKIDHGIRNFNLPRSKVRNRGKISLKQSLIYIHHFPPPSPRCLFYSPQISSQKQSILSRKKVMERHLSPFPSNLRLWSTFPQTFKERNWDNFLSFYYMFTRYEIHDTYQALRRSPENPSGKRLCWILVIFCDRRLLILNGNSIAYSNAQVTYDIKYR